jgi:phosphoadenosine phosphosulfate reductase
MDTIKEKDAHIAHLNQQYDQIRVAQLCVLQQVDKILSQIIKLKQQYGIKEYDIEQIKKELDFIPQCLDNAKLGVQIAKPVISSTVDPYYRSIFENMDTSMPMEFQSIEYEVTNKTVKNEHQILKHQLQQQHIHQFEIRKKHNLLNGLNANEQRIEDAFQIKSEIDTNDKINQSNAPCTGAEALMSDSALETLNQWLETQTAERRVAWALSELPGTYVLSSSFGAQAAVSLHLLTTQKPDIPVLLVDTGYLFPETYNFIDQLHERLQLNLHVLRPEISAAWFEARHGRLWEQGVDGIDLYNCLMKLNPMQLALDKLGVKTWFAGLRRNQSESRQRIRIIERQNGRWKVHPIAD